jgi:hypothetical protein
VRGLARRAFDPGHRATMMWLALVALCALATYVVFVLLDPYDPTEERLVGGAFATTADLDAWTVKAPPGAVRIENNSLLLETTPERRNAMLSQTVPIKPGDAAYRLSALVRIVGVEPGPKRFHLARIYVAGRDAEDTPIAFSRSALVRDSGTHPWEWRETVATVGEGAVAAMTVLRLHNAVGRLEVRDLSLVALKLSATFRGLRIAVAAAWAIVLVCGAWRFAGRVQNRRLLVVLSLAAFGGLVLLLAPEYLRTAAILPVAVLTGGALGTEGISTLGHFAIFTVLALLTRVTAPHGRARLQLLVLLALAGVTELLQFLAVDRSPSVEDWAVNGIGVVAGLATAELLRLPTKRAARRRGEEKGTPKRGEGAEAPSRS